LSKFRFKEFSIQQDVNTHKVGTDAMLLGAYIDASRQSLALDIGAGTGVLSLMLAQRNPTIQITCIEIDEKSSEECSANIMESPWSNRIHLINNDFIEYQFTRKFDLIFSNPPYYLTDNSSNDDTMRTKHITLTKIEEWFCKIASLLLPEGVVWMIWPSESSERIIEIALKHKLLVLSKINLYSKANNLTRTILCFSFQENNVVKEDALIIRNHDNFYSDAYRSLTSDFHYTEFNA
jgi:tRNA1Val (adenine37-N6)-methyltransferase